MKVRGRTLKHEALLFKISITPSSLMISTPIQYTNKTLFKDILKKLIKDHERIESRDEWIEVESKDYFFACIGGIKEIY